MCLAIPMEILETDGARARVGLDGNIREADVTLVENPVAGDWVLLHAGFAIGKLSREEAEEALVLLRQMGEAASDSEG